MTSNSGKVRSHHPERVTLSKEALIRVEGWQEQVAPLLKGSKISRSELVNWILLERSEELATPEMKILAARFFDPIKALEWASIQVRDALKRGAALDVNEVIQDIMRPQFPASPKVRKARKRAKAETAS